MATIKGAGPCPIPKENGLPCGLQIQEGDPRGTVSMGTAHSPQSVSGHKRCADAYYARKMSQERERNLSMVQRINQDGPGGAVDPSKAFNPVEGSVPLEKPEPTPMHQADPSAPLPGTPIQGDMSQGAHFIGDVPEDASPGEAVQYAAKEQPEHLVGVEDVARVYGLNPQQIYQQGYHPQQSQQGVNLNDIEYQTQRESQPVMTAWQSHAKGILGDPMPKVDVIAARVVLTELHVRTDGTLHLDPEDAEDLIALLGVNVNRARRQQL
jgi:hypothetical protein